MMIGVVIGTIAIVLVTVVIGLLVDRRVPVLPTPQPPEAPRKPAAIHEVGEAPATALRLREAQLDRLKASQRCPQCRASMQAEPDELVRYDDADLRVLRFTCTRCDGRRTLYAAIR